MKKKTNKKNAEPVVTDEERLELNMIHAVLVQKFAEFHQQNPGKRITQFEIKEIEDLVFGDKGRNPG